MDNFFVQTGGGLGDFIYDYLLSYQWRVIPTIKEMYPDCTITAVAACHNPSVIELIYTNTLIDGFLSYPWRAPGSAGETDWRKLIKGTDLGPWAKKRNIQEAGEKHKIVLTQEEKELVTSFYTNGKKFVVIHPFAGLPHRGCRPHPFDGKYKCMPDYKFVQIANFLCELGYTPVIVGRTSFDGREVLRNAEESLSTSITMNPKVIDLTNKVSVRVNVELARRANGFIGMHSSILSAAWTGNTPSVFFYPNRDEHDNIRSVFNYGGHTGTWALDREYHNYFEMSGDEFLDLDFKVPVLKLMEHIR